MWIAALVFACQGAVAPCKSPLGAADSDCDGLDDRDGDGDGAVSMALGGDDCDDADPALNPADADGDGASTCEGDCDDTRADIGVRGVTPDTCDNVDNDCNGVVDVDDLGNPACLEVENFPQPLRLKLDLLVVVDDTGSMLDEDGRLADVQPALFAVLDGTDTHVGIITTNGEDALIAGKLHAPVGGGDRFLNVLENTPEETIAWWRGATAVGASALHADAPFDAAFSAIAIQGDVFNAGFYRDDADFAVWFVSDTEDNSQSFSQTEFIGWLAGLKLGSALDPLVTAVGIIPLDADSCTFDAGGESSFEDLVAATGGVAGTVCDLDWSPTATAIAELVAPTTQILLPLAKIPIPATLTAELHLASGQTESLPASALQYDPLENTVSIAGRIWGEFPSIDLFYERLP